MKKIVITGGTGMIGAVLGSELAAAGWDLHLLCRGASGRQGQIAFPATLHEWGEANQYEVPAEALAGAQGVVHLAGEPIAGGRWTAARKRRILASRVDSTKALAQAVADLPVAERPKFFVQASAVGFYGDRGEEQLPESSSAGLGFLADVCQAWEKAAEPLEQTGVRTAKVRIGVVLGHEGGALQTLNQIYSSCAGAKFGDGKMWFPYVHVDDVIGIFKHLIDHESAAGIFNAVAPEPVQMGTFHSALSKAIGRPNPWWAPLFAVRILLGEMAELLLNSQRVVPENLKTAGYTFKYPDLAACLSELYPSGWEKGIQHLVSRQWVPYSTEEIWPFFTDETNLEKITPPLLSFKVLGKDTPEIKAGTHIRYKLKLRGIPMRWKTLIADWQPGKRFVDMQLSGPYDIWHHTHSFKQLAGGTLMLDHVRFRLPMSPLGDMVAGWFVRRDVQKIFRYRQQVIGQTFPMKQRQPAEN